MKKLCIILVTIMSLFFISNNATSIDLEKNSGKGIAIDAPIVVTSGEKDPIIFSIEV